MNKRFSMKRVNKNHITFFSESGNLWTSLFSYLSISLIIQKEILWFDVDLE